MRGSQVGRGLRVSDDKEKTLFLDNVGLYNLFGFPSSSRRWVQYFKGKDAKARTVTKEDKGDVIERKAVQRNFAEGNEVVHLIQTSEEKENFESRKISFTIFFICHAIHISVTLRRRFEEIYIDGLGLKMDNSCYLDGDWESYNDLQVYIKEQTRDLAYYLKNENFFIWTYPEGARPNCEYRPCRNYDELLIELNKKFQHGREFEYAYKSKYEEFLENNYTEEEIFDLVADIIQNQVVHEKADLVGIDKIPLYFSIIDFWRGAHKHYKKKLPKCLDWLILATETALNNRL